MSAGEFFSALDGRFDVPTPGGSPALEDAAEVALDAALVALLNPGDCPGGMKGDCGELER